MNYLQILIVALIISITGNSLNAQSNVKTFNFKKGEILDILVLTSKPDSKLLFENYKKTAFPVAMKMSYQPQPGFGIAENLQGNIQPSSFIFGKWENLAKREQFLGDIEKEVPDFHEQRRAIFSTFYLTYFEMQKDINFEIDKDKVIIATAYWADEIGDFKKFKKQFLKETEKAGGAIKLSLTNGKSPFGYYYQPDLLVISQWEDKASFEKFYAKNLKMNPQGVKQVNQFLLK